MFFANPKEKALKSSAPKTKIIIIKLTDPTQINSQDPNITLSSSSSGPSPGNAQVTGGIVTLRSAAAGPPSFATYREPNLLAPY